MLNALIFVVFNRRSIYYLWFIFLFFFSFNVKAEGSKDLYPWDAKGARASMYSTSTTSPLSSFPFKTKGTHYVYAKVGEWICVASSAQGLGNGKIILTSPTGESFETTKGCIPDRSQELLGPLEPESTSNKSYKPYSHKVTDGLSGVWRIDFIAPAEHDKDFKGPEPPDLYATDDWVQTQSAPKGDPQTKVYMPYFIVAWDISVRDETNQKWRPGRVYANVLNLGLKGIFNDPNKGYYGNNYVLTKDGRAYYVRNNGNNGYGFTFFANNKGFIDANGTAIYKSLNASSADVGDGVHDPRKIDDEVKNLITHKLFYSPPDFNLPQDAPIWIDGKTNSRTWLKQKAVIPEVSDVTFIGAEGTIGQAGVKGGYINFSANVPGSYRIIISIPNRPSRILLGPAVKDLNAIRWDGRDGEGDLVPPTLTNPEVRVQLTSAEVHFPFFDMEINPKGIIIELAANEDGYPVERDSKDESIYNDRVYWDDSDVSPGALGEAPNPVKNTEGRRSYDDGKLTANGHKWGTYNDAGSGEKGNSGKGGVSFGNDKAIDTWAYILSNDAVTKLNLEIKVTDLKISSIVTEITDQQIDSEVIYRIKVENLGPSAVSGAKFAARLPNGITVTDISFESDGSCGQEHNRKLNGQLISSELTFPNEECIVEYVIKGVTTQIIPPAGLTLEASILRPNDVTDIDASNKNFETLPTDPHEECYNETDPEVCNNIKYHAIQTLNFCVGSSIAPFSYELAAGGTHYIADIIPDWLTVNISGGKVVFSGTPLVSGSFYFSIGTDGNEREKTGYLITVINPIITKQPQANPVCEGSDAVFTVEAGDTDTYQWEYEDAGEWKGFIDDDNVTGSTTSILRISAILLTDPRKRIRVIVSAATGCSLISNEIVLVINAMPTQLSVILGEDVICEDGSTTLRSELKADNYQWYWNGQVIPNATNERYTVSEAGIYTLALGNAEGCLGAQSEAKEVEVISYPDVPIIHHGNLTVCFGNTVTLTSDPAATYQWYRDGNAIDGATSQEYVADISGGYAVMVSNGGICKEISTRKVVVIGASIPNPEIVLNSDDLTFCEGGSVTLNSSSATGNQWYKDGDEIDGATGDKYIATESGIYTVKVANASGCFLVSAGATVTVNQMPTEAKIVVKTADLTFCEGGSVTLASSSATGNQWYKEGDEIDGATDDKYIATESGVYTVKVTNASGCFLISAGVTVLVNLPPTEAKIIVNTTDLTFCEGGSVTLTSSSATGNQWYKDGDEIDGATDDKYIATESGIYTVKVTNASGCFLVSAGATVLVNLPPTEAKIIVNATDLTFCEGGSVRLTSSSAIGNQWYKDGDEVDGATDDKYIATESGIYTVKVTNASGCFLVSGEATVLVNLLPTEAKIIAKTADLIFCEGGSVTLTSSSAGGNQWYKDGDEVDGATDDKYIATESGIYTVKVTNGSGCFLVSVGVTVTVNQMPTEAKIIVNTTDLTFCEGGSVTLTSSSATGNQWYINGDEINGATDNKYVATESGIYTVRITNASGCFLVSAGETVKVNQMPTEAKIIVNTTDLTFCEGGSVTLTSSSATGNQWYKNGDEIDGATGEKYITAESGIYTVKVANASGCFLVSAGATVLVNLPPTEAKIIVNTADLTFCEGGSVTLASSSSTGNQWHKDGQKIDGAIDDKYIATESGIYTVKVTNAGGCFLISSGVSVIANALPSNPVIIVNPNDLTNCEGSSVILSSSSEDGNQWYKNGNLIIGETNQTLVVNVSGNYTVKVTNTVGCVSAMSQSSTVTINKKPKGHNDQINSLSCTTSSFSYDLQNNVNNIAEGGNAIPARFTWTANSSTVTGVSNGMGEIITATLVNTSTITQNVVYTVIPVSEIGACVGEPFTVTVQVPACIAISINKTADKSVVSAVDEKITYTIIIRNDGNANHTQVKVNDEMFGGLLSQPAGDNGNGILEKGESWIYKKIYIIKQSDLDHYGIPVMGTGKIVNTATLSTLESPSPKSAIVAVDLKINPSITLLKTGKLDRGFKTITYTFKIKNNGNVRLNDLTLTDLKFVEPITLKQTTLAPGASMVETVVYTVTEAEKIAGSVANTATIYGVTISGLSATDISGTAERNDDPTIVDLVRYPIAFDDYATTKAGEEVIIVVTDNDRPALFPLNQETVNAKSHPSNGKINVAKDGKVTYMPNKGFIGADKFTYSIADLNGLSSNIAEVRIDVTPLPLEIPNAFTPNGDGKNDTFLIKGLEDYDGVSLFVYNRWGDEVYQNNNYKNEWDGNGLNDGTYFYVLKLKKGKTEDIRRNWILIKR